MTVDDEDKVICQDCGEEVSENDLFMCDECNLECCVYCCVGELCSDCDFKRVNEEDEEG